MRRDLLGRAVEEHRVKESTGAKNVEKRGVVECLKINGGANAPAPTVSGSTTCLSKQKKGVTPTIKNTTTDRPGGSRSGGRRGCARVSREKIEGADGPPATLECSDSQCARS